MAAASRAQDAAEVYNAGPGPHARGSRFMQHRYSLVIGLGATGVAAARYLARLGKTVVVMDSRADPPGRASLAASNPEIEVVLGRLDDERLAGADQLVLSPGLPVDLPLILDAKALGLPVVSEIELFAKAATAPVLAVTGSNGKSTVATLVARLIESQGLTAPAGGNLGPPAVELLNDDADAYVLEISSFQMETTESLRPYAAAVLNVSPDHIDRHGNIDRYSALKEQLLVGADRAIVNLDDPSVRAMGQRAQARGQAVVGFSLSQSLERGWSIVLRDGIDWIARDLEPLIDCMEAGLRGSIERANALAALALAESMIDDWPAALAALAKFEGLPHRMRRIAEHGGVIFVDDSKATNVGACTAAIRASDGPIVLIAGGLAKGADFDVVADAARGKVRAAVLIGRAAPELERALSPVCQTVHAADMQTAVQQAFRLARSGETVLLSPACASQDMFSDYRERGLEFARSVEALKP